VAPSPSARPESTTGSAGIASLSPPYEILSVHDFHGNDGAASPMNVVRNRPEGRRRTPGVNPKAGRHAPVSSFEASKNRS